MTRGNATRIVGLALVTLAAATILLLATPRTTTAPTAPPSVIPTATIAASDGSSPRPSATPVSTPTVDVNSPLALGWDDFTLPTLAAPWALGESSGNAFSTLAVLRSGVAIGFVEQWTSLPEAYPGTDLRHRGFEALRKQAEDDLQSFVTDRAAAGGELRAEPDPIREIDVAGGRGVRIAFRDVEVATGKVLARHVFVYHFDGRALWLFSTRWPPDSEVLASTGFRTLADQLAFDPQLEVLVAGLSLPVTLPTPEPLAP
ncbi:MAG: hypothetical protein HYX55_11790 [Chloroflexi bacterium]|nr:hypothetical protein [Chloroflexota bacterium]